MITGLTDFAQKKFDWLAGAAFDFGKDVFETGLGFDAAMANTQSVLGSVEGNLETMNKLRKYAIDQARDSVFTTEDAANAYYYMGQMGWDAEQMMAGLPAVLDLAAASGLGLEQTSRIVSSSLSAFGKEAEDAEWYVDILAQTSRNSGTDVSEMAQALKYAAPYAGALGVSVDDTALALGLMGDNAIRSGMAGRTLRNVFSRLANDTNDALTTLQGLGVEVFDDTGKFRDFSDIIMDSREVWASMTDQQKIANATIVAGQQGSSGWLSIMNATDDKVKDLTESIQSATGAAQEMADTRIGTNLAGDLTKFKSAMNGMETVIYDDINGPLREAVQWGTDAINEITDAIGENGLTGGIEIAGEKIEEAGEKFRPMLESIGKAAAPVLTTVLEETLPALDDTIVSLGHSLGGGLFTGLSDSLKEKYPLLAGLAGTLGYGLSTDTRHGVGSLTSGDMNPLKVPEVHAETITFDGVEFTADQLRDALNNVIHDPLWGDQVELAGRQVSVDIAQALLESLSDAGEKGGKQMMENVSAEVEKSVDNGVGKPTRSAFADAGLSGGSDMTANIFDIMFKDAPGISDILSGELGDSGVTAGNSIVGDIQSALNLASFTVSVVGVVSQVVNTVRSIFSHNASAMSSGRIYTKPTVFGYYDNAYQVAGDAGPEAVVGVNSLQRMITSAVHGASGQEVVIPRNQSRDMTVILELERQQLAKTVYKLNNEETQRVGVRLSRGGAY